MASSRLEKLGTIFGRVTGLLRSGALKREDKPLWYAVYQVFPPKRRPSYDAVVPKVEIRPIFYPEDSIRANFHKKMNRMISFENLTKKTSSDITRRVVSLTQDALRNDESLSENQAVDRVINALKSEGYFMTRRSSRTSVKPGTDKATDIQMELKPRKFSSKKENNDPIKEVDDKNVDVSDIVKDG